MDLGPVEWTRTADGGRGGEDVGRGVDMLVCRGVLLQGGEKERNNLMIHMYSLAKALMSKFSITSPAFYLRLPALPLKCYTLPRTPIVIETANAH